MSKKTKKPEAIADDEVTPPLGTTLPAGLDPQEPIAPTRDDAADFVAPIIPALVTPAPGAAQCPMAKGDKACTLAHGHAGHHHHVPSPDTIDAIVSWA